MECSILQIVKLMYLDKLLQNIKALYCKLKRVTTKQEISRQFRAIRKNLNPVYNVHNSSYTVIISYVVINTKLIKRADYQIYNVVN